MNALIVYESMYGNTEAVANAIADGLGPECTTALAASRAGYATTATR